MTRLLTRILSSVCFFSAIVSLPLFTASFAQAKDSTGTGGVYQTGPSNINYTDITTLNEFSQLVYRGRWAEIDVNNVLQEFARFKGTPHSPAMRDIWRDIMLSDFNGIKIKNSAQQTQLMAERIRILNRLGFFDEAVRLYQLASDRKPVPQDIALQGVEALALSGSADGACLEVTMATQYLKDDHWTQDGALCAAYFGNKELAKTLYDQANANAGSGFRTVYKLISSKSANKAIQVSIPPLWRTLLLAQNATVTSQALKEADGMTLAALANNHKVPLNIRITAALRGAEQGTVGADRLRGLYESKYPEDASLGGIVGTAEAGGNLGAAEYYSAARFTFEGNARSRIVKNALHRSTPVTHVKNHVYAWIVDKLTLQGNKIAWFAPEGYAAMIMTNRTDSGLMYYNVGHLEKTPFNYMNALIQNKPWAEADQLLWVAAMKKRYGKDADQKITEYMALVKAYDLENKLDLLPQPFEQDTSRNRNSVLYQSVKNGGKGLTLLNALNILADSKQLSAVQMPQFVDIIETMTKEGLFGERKKITLEFLIQNML
jgi:hypothetical protein